MTGKIETMSEAIDRIMGPDPNGESERYFVERQLRASAKAVDNEIEALQRRNAEMADALDNVLDYQHRLPEWLVDKVHAALTPTESEA